MSRTWAKEKPRCAWCGNKIKHPRRAARAKGKLFCEDGSCGGYPTGKRKENGSWEWTRTFS